MPLVLLLLLVPIAAIALMPLILIQRYRAGKARRQARRWVTTLNLAAMAFSALFFLAGSVVTTIWIPHAFTGAALGMIVGLLLGLFGLAITRWEAGPGTLHYTPNSWLVLLVTLIVSARLVYGLVRSLLVARSGVTGAALVGAFGVPQSLAAGAVVLGYYLSYNAGLRWRLRTTRR